jgi:hypothetical protein
LSSQSGSTSFFSPIDKSPASKLFVAESPQAYFILPDFQPVENHSPFQEGLEGMLGNLHPRPEQKSWKLSIKEAWALAVVSRRLIPTIGSNFIEFNFLTMNLRCSICNHENSSANINIPDDAYIYWKRNTNDWWEGEFLTSFSCVLAHYCHLFKEKIGVGHSLDVPFMQLVQSPCKTD